MDGRHLACYQEWYQRQALDLDELVDALSADDGSARQDAELRDLVNKSMRHYEEYYQRRRLLVHEDGPTFYCPPWCNSFESAFLWLGGCRPSLFIRLLYSLSSADLEAHVQGDRLLADEAAVVAEAAFSAAAGGRGVMALSPTQLDAVNRLHCRTLQEEDELSSQMATLQEDVADRPLLPVVNERHQEMRRLMLRRRIGRGGEGTSSGAGAGETDQGVGNEVDGEVEAAMEGYARKLGRLLEAADEMRVSTAREMLMEILTPKQAVELLVAGKQLHISIHEWGHKRDFHRGRGRQLELMTVADDRK